MNGQPVLRDRIHRAIEWGDYVRGRRGRLGTGPGYREWLHFCLTSGDIDVLVNFSLSDDTRPAALPDAELARVICMVRSAHESDGDVDDFEPHEVHVASGGLDLRFGRDALRFHRGQLHIVVRAKRRPVFIDLVFRPVTVPSVVNDMVLSDDQQSHWFLVPCLLATGTVRVNGREWRLANALAYHDHNWGYFRWGRDFGWLWGYGHAIGADDTWSVTFGRQTDRAGAVDYVRGLALWRGPRQWRLFDTRDVTITEHGLLRDESSFTLPRAAAMLLPAKSAGVPARLHCRAASRGDVLDLEFLSDRVSRLLVPNDDDLGFTVISEVTGHLRLKGFVHGEPIEAVGRGVCEFLGA